MHKGLKNIKNLIFLAMFLPLFVHALPAYADEITRTRDMETISSVSTENVAEDASFFSDRIIYTTFDKDKDITSELEEYVTVNGSTYHFDALGEPSVLKTDTVIPRTMDYTTQTFTGNENNHLPPSTMTDADGFSYSLISQTLDATPGGSHTEYREMTTSYTGVEKGATVPSEKEFTLSDSAGETVTVTLPEVRRTEKDGYWQDTFQFPITITGYDADTFMLGDKEISKNEDLSDYADDFLAILGMDPEMYKITSVRWEGEQYEENGEVCRTAIAFGSKYVQDIDVTYGGSVTFPVAESKQWICVYEEDIPENERTLYTMGVNVSYTQEYVPVPEETESVVESVVENVTGSITAAYEATIQSFEDHPVTSSIPVVAAALVIVLLVTRRAQNRCRYDRSFKCPYKKKNKATCRTCSHYRGRSKV